MSDSLNNAMRQRLLAERKKLESVEASANEASQIVELDQSRVGRLSRMDAMQAQAMAQAADRRRAVTLREISAALTRIDEGVFGDCQSCDEPIHPKRLEFDPTTTLCVECASKAEDS